MRVQKLNLNKAPYRGVLTEIAKEEGVTPNAIWAAVYKHNNLRILTILEQKVSQRKATYRRVKNVIGRK